MSPQPLPWNRRRRRRRRRRRFGDCRCQSWLALLPWIVLQEHSELFFRDLLKNGVRWFAAEAAMTVPKFIFDRPCDILMYLPFSTTTNNNTNNNKNTTNTGVNSSLSTGSIREESSSSSSSSSSSTHRHDHRHRWTSIASLKTAKESLSHMAAAALAMTHVFTNNGSVVKELAMPEMQQCLLPYRSEGLSVLNNQQIPAQQAQGLSPQTRGIQFCSTLARMDVASSDVFVTVAEALRNPMITVASTLPRLTYFDFVVRNDVEMASTVQVLVEYLTALYSKSPQQAPQEEQEPPVHVAVLYDGSEYGTSFMELLQQHTHQQETAFLSFRGHGIVAPLQNNNNDNNDNHHRASVCRAIQQVWQSGNVIFLVAVTQWETLLEIAECAHLWNLLGPDFLWLLADIPLSSSYEPLNAVVAHSPLEQLLRGAGMIQSLDGFAWRRRRQNDNDPFETAWKQASPDTAAWLMRLAARQGVVELSPRDYFTTQSPTRYSSFVYDAVIATALASCNISRAILQEAPNPFELNVAQVVTAFVDNIRQALLQTSFQGASGFVQFDAQHASRTIDSVVFGMYNLQPQNDNDEEDDDDDGETDEDKGEASLSTRRILRYETVLTMLRTKEAGGWKNVEFHPSFRYFNGTTIPPLPTRQVRDFNFITSHALGWGLMACSLGVSAVSALWIHLHRHESLVRAAQPSFLHLMCLGSALSALTIFVLSMDEGRGWTTAQLHAGCVAAPWLFFVGYTMTYLAIFCKLWRVNQILQFHRVAVRFQHVLGPFVALLTIAILTLAVWTIVDPPRWTRTIVSEYPLYESVGRCSSSHSTIFGGILLGLAIACTLLTALMAWKTKHVRDELSESYFIFVAIFVQLQTWMVSLPILVEEAEDDSYVATVVVIWTLSISMVLLVMGPKMLRWIHLQQQHPKWIFGTGGWPREILGRFGRPMNHDNENHHDDDNNNNNNNNDMMEPQTLSPSSPPPPPPRDSNNFMLGGTRNVKSELTTLSSSRHLRKAQLTPLPPRGASHDPSSISEFSQRHEEEDDSSSSASPSHDDNNNDDDNDDDAPSVTPNSVEAELLEVENRIQMLTLLKSQLLEEQQRALSNLSSRLEPDDDGT